LVAYPVSLGGLKCATRKHLSVGLLTIEKLLLIFVVIFSSYSSYIDWRTLTYPPDLALVLLWVGIVSATLRLILSIRSLDVFHTFPLDFVGALACFFFLNKMQIIADGDFSYFFSVGLCFPRYPYSLVDFLTQYLRLTPQVSYNTSLAMVLLTNSCLLTPHLFALAKLLKGNTSLYWKACYLLFSILGVLSMNMEVSVFLPFFMVPLSQIQGSTDAEQLPMIPCLFLSLVLSLTFGDLLLVLS
jgi:hypothetical protein